LSKEIFKGISNFISFTSDDYIRYFAGAHTVYTDAVKHRNEMLLRGFEGAFVVAFKDGKKIGLNAAIRDTNGKPPRKKKTRRPSNKVEKKEVKQKVEKKEVKSNVEYVVQIGVYKENVPANVLAKITKIGNPSKENVNGSKLYRYYAGRYPDFYSANARLNEVKSAGFNDAFIKALLDGKQITIEKAKTLSE